MPARPTLSTFVVGLCCLMLSPRAGQAQSTVILPEFVVTDTLGAVLGTYVDHGPRLGGTSAPTYVRILRQDPVHGDSYSLYVGKNNLQGVDEDDVYYELNDCTGKAYLQTPQNYTGELSELRGSVYAIGKDPVSGTDTKVLRATGMGADNSALMMSRYRADADGSSTGCNGGQTTTSPTVEAEQVDDLSSFTRPYKIE